MTSNLVAQLQEWRGVGSDLAYLAAEKIERLSTRVEELEALLLKAASTTVETPVALPRNETELAQLFHETYERLAPSHGYETRPETRRFDPNSPNGRLMRAVCAEILARDTVKAPTELKPCEHLRSELLAEKQKDGEPLFEMRKCLDCTKVFRVRSSLKTAAQPIQCVFRTGCVNGQACIDAGHCTHGAEMLQSMSNAEKTTAGPHDDLPVETNP
jgi:hypothetical protein